MAETSSIFLLSSSSSSLLLLLLLLFIGISGNAAAQGIERAARISSGGRSKVHKRGTTDGRGGITCDEMSTIVEVHNALRSSEQASNMKKMRWNSILADAAVKYADKCLWQHGDLEVEGLPYTEVGQNLYGSVNEAVKYDFIIKMWYDEKKFFNFTHRTCAAGEMCGHYTQVVWANSSDIGCAHKLCEVLQRPNADPLKNSDYVVCYYGPSGNYRDVPLYNKGAACSSCPPGFGLCDGGLCSPGPGGAAGSSPDLYFCTDGVGRRDPWNVLGLVVLLIVAWMNFGE